MWLTARIDDSSGFCHKLIGCLQLHKLPTAIAVSPALVLADDDISPAPHVAWQPGFDQTAPSGQKARKPLRVLHLAVGFEDGSVLEQSMALRVSTGEGSLGEPSEALWWEERSWHSGAKEGYHFTDSGEVGDSGVSAWI